MGSMASALIHSAFRSIRSPYVEPRLGEAHAAHHDASPPLIRELHDLSAGHSQECPRSPTGASDDGLRHPVACHQGLHTPARPPPDATRAKIDPRQCKSAIQGENATAAVASATISPASIELSARAPGLTAATKRRYGPGGSAPAQVCV